MSTAGERRRATSERRQANDGRTEPVYELGTSRPRWAGTRKLSAGLAGSRRSRPFRRETQNAVVRPGPFMPIVASRLFNRNPPRKFFPPVGKSFPARHAGSFRRGVDILILVCLSSLADRNVRPTRPAPVGRTFLSALGFRQTGMSAPRPSVASPASAGLSACDLRFIGIHFRCRAEVVWFEPPGRPSGAGHPRASPTRGTPAMLTIHGRPQRLCDGIPRRSFLKIGAFAFGAAQFSLADVLRAEQSLGRTSHKAVINVFLGGGPPHQDMWETKTEAPSEIRGEFKPIATRVPGIQIGECFPKIAAMADRFTFIRSVVGARDRHEAVQCTTGRHENEFRNVGGWPSMGSLLSKLQGSVEPSVPPFVGLAAKTQHVPWSDSGRPGFLGPAYGAFKPEGNGVGDMKLNGINQAHIGDRKKLREAF